MNDQQQRLITNILRASAREVFNIATFTAIFIGCIAIYGAYLTGGFEKIVSQHPQRVIFCRDVILASVLWINLVIVIRGLKAEEKKVRANQLHRLAVFNGVFWMTFSYSLTEEKVIWLHIYVANWQYLVVALWMILPNLYLFIDGQYFTEDSIKRQRHRHTLIRALWVSFLLIVVIQYW